MAKPWQVVAIVDRSAGNESGVWKETKVFDMSTTLLDILEWAHGRQYMDRLPSDPARIFRGNVTLTIAQ